MYVGWAVMDLYRLKFSLGKKSNQIKAHIQFGLSKKI
jgi:hypothetical protein